MILHLEGQGMLWVPWGYLLSAADLVLVYKQLLRVPTCVDSVEIPSLLSNMPIV